MGRRTRGKLQGPPNRGQFLLGHLRSFYREDGNQEPGDMYHSRLPYTIYCLMPFTGR